MSLLLLIGITALSVTAVSTGIMEMRMAQNAEFASDTFQTAMAAVDFAISDPSHLPTSGPLNQPSSISLSGSPFAVTGSDTVSATATRVADCQLPPRMRNATSLAAYSAFQYELSAEVSRNASGMGTSNITQGYLLLGPKC